MCVALELSTLAPSQYTWNMAGMVEVAGVGYGGDEDGFYQLTGSTDAGTDIDASFKLPTTDFGMNSQKRMRSLCIGYETDGELEVTVKADEKHSMVKHLKPGHNDVSQGRKLPVNRDIKGRYFDVEISNTNGCDFGINDIDVLILRLAGRNST
jgi:hypothetical protein